MKRFFSLLLLLSLGLSCLCSCGVRERRERTYAVLASIEIDGYTAAGIMVPTHSTPDIYPGEHPEEYEKISALGTSCIPYMLEYVLEKDSGYFDEMFIVCSVYVMLEIDEWYDINRHDPHAHAEALLESLK
ncbi:MAG: hypothetical protein IJX62_02490 [Clostridia bacterium]|nr:hypothetical protein [Clostridia bacterium]